MVTLSDRRDYWVSENGQEVELQDRNGVITIPDGQPVTQEDLEAIPEVNVHAYLTSVSELAGALAAEDIAIAQALLDSNLSDVDHATMEAAIVEETSAVKKIARISWALLKVYNRRQ